MKEKLREALQGALGRFGLRLTRLPRFGPDRSRPLPAGAAEQLRGDNPRLVELRQRYAAVTSPLAVHSFWTADYVQRDLELAYFRGDNAYVWQLRHLGDSAVLRYFLYAEEVAARDARGWLRTLVEDGAFGCHAFDFPGWPLLSRDLLDSVHELGFLDRHAGIASHAGLRVLDIGAGYGRLAHRGATALPQLARWTCVDAVAESTFLCEWYLRHRGVTDRTEVIPLDELDTQLPQRRFDLALNIHSFTEMKLAAIEAWWGWLQRLEVPRVLVVPNDAEAFLSSEGDGTRREFLPVIERAGYRLAVKEPVVQDPARRKLSGQAEHFFLFERR